MSEEAKVYLSLGSNVGDRLEQLRGALRSLRANRVRIVKLSSVYETEPVCFQDQPWFLNLVTEARVAHSPLELVRICKAIEDSLGRQRSFKNAPRAIDIDILWYDGQSLRTPELELPHPRLGERHFVLVPLAEIAPEFEPLREGCADRSRVQRYCNAEQLEPIMDV